MNKAQFIEVLSSTHFNGNKAQASQALNAVLQTITHQVATGEKVTLTGFGSFEKVHRPARQVRNPRTGERKRTKATAVPRFRAGADLKANVADAKKATSAKVSTTRARPSQTAAAPAKVRKTPARRATTTKQVTPAKRRATKEAL